MTDAAAVLARVAAMLPDVERPVLVGIDGPDGAGKTTFADALAAHLESSGRTAVRASVDDFHHPRAHRHAEGRTAEAVWSRHFDHVTLRHVLLDPWRLGPGSSYRVRWHDLATDQRAELELDVVPEEGVLVVDGLFLQREGLSGVWDLVVYLDVPDQLGLRRVDGRDGPLDQHERYAGAQRIYRERCRPRERADVVIDNADLDEPTISVEGLRQRRTRR